MKEEDIEKVAIELTKVNNLEFNIAKVVEESMETNELLVKYLTKMPSLKPSKAAITEEVGDLLFRLMVMVNHMDIKEAVGLRVEQKAKMLEKAMKTATVGSTLVVTKKIN